MGSNITMVCTSCERHDLLKQTLDSLIAVGCGGAKPDAAIIIEDSASPMPDWLRDNIHYYSSNLGKVEWVSNGGRRGQVYSIDRAYALVKTDYIFHLEDDFEFLRGGNWMVESKKILERYPLISMVSLRGNDCNNHPNIDWPAYEGFKIQMPYWHKVWGGINYNAGLRRLSDYKRIGSYGRHVQYGAMGLETEYPISKLYLDMGYRIAVLPDARDGYEPYVRHMNIRSKMNDGYIVPLPKILIAIPVTHCYQYGRWESGDSPHYDPSIAWEGKPYGMGIHISEPNDRIQALRGTWLKDVAKFKHVDYKLFYGRPGGEVLWQDDEVMLNCGDGYADLPAKTIAICKYAKDHSYDLLFKCDDDTGVYVERVIHEAMYGQWDYAGYLNGRVATGGTGYWLSKRAFSLVADHASSGSHWAEDVTVGKCLFAHGIQPVHLEGHRHGGSDHWFWAKGYDPSVDTSKISSFHAVRPEDMRAWYADKEKKIG